MGNYRYFLQGHFWSKVGDSVEVVPLALPMHWHAGRLGHCCVGRWNGNDGIFNIVEAALLSFDGISYELPLVSQHDFQVCQHLLT